MCGIYSCIGLPPDFLAQALAITCIPHEGPSLNALSILGCMNHWPNCCIDSYMPIDGSMVAIFCPSISLVWGQRVMPVSCGSFRVICAGFMLDKITACGLSIFQDYWGLEAILIQSLSFQFWYICCSPISLFVLSKLLSWETDLQIWGTRSALGIICQSWLVLYMLKVIFEHVGDYNFRGKGARPLFCVTNCVGGQHNSFCGLRESTDVVKMVNVMMNADKLKRSAQSGCLTVHFQPLS